ncbi:MAG: chemotaxis protein CheX, partial [Thermodesulfobacteriota bacterium]|nr:chemotaxis protein CheX [Thermodesulfobacteriota bacterium]
LHAIELQEKTNLRFGDLVTQMGLMTRKQIDLTHRSQRHEDLRFGDMAVKMGFLSADQIEQVLDRQRKNHLFIGEALVKLAAITKGELELYLDEFIQSQKNYAPDKTIIPADIPHQPICKIATDMTCKMLTRVAGVTFHTGSCTTTRTILAKSVDIEVEFSGSISVHYLLTITDSTRKLMTKAILKENKITNRSAEEIDNAAQEFVNIICGNVVSKAAQLGYQIHASTAKIRQQNDTTPEIPGNQSKLLLPIHFSSGEILELTISVQRESECR